MDKVVNERGEVAVLVSTDYGAGWSTWNRPIIRGVKDCLFSPEVVDWVLNGKQPETRPNFQELFGEDFYDGGAESLAVYWVRQGELFRIDEYDGAESIVLATDDEWITA